MLLCPNHHREATVGAMPEAEQRQYKSNPYNRRFGLAEGRLKLFQSVLALQLGSTVLVGEGILLEVDDFPLLELRLGNEKVMELSVSLYNQAGDLLAEISRNEWVTGDPLPWDIEFGIRWLKLREKKGRISLAIDARKFPTSIRGHLWYEQHKFQINKSFIKFGDERASGGIEALGLVAFRLRINTADGSLAMIPDQRWGEARLVSQPSTLDRLLGSIQAWQGLKYPDLSLRNR